MKRRIVLYYIHLTILIQCHPESNKSYMPLEIGSKITRARRYKPREITDLNFRRFSSSINSQYPYAKLYIYKASDRTKETFHLPYTLSGVTNVKTVIHHRYIYTQSVISSNIKPKEVLWQLIFYHPKNISL